MIELDKILAKFQKEGDLAAHETALVLGLALGLQTRIKELENEIHSLKAIIASHEWNGKYPTNKPDNADG